MIGCAACGRLGVAPLCTSCTGTLTPGRDVVTATGLVIRSGLLHRDAARRLVHNLKYRGIEGAVPALAPAMAARVAPHTPALVPVPRASLRRVRFGIDPARRLAAAVARLTGTEVVDALRPGLWWPRHATRPPEARDEPRFRVVAGVPPGSVLVDDVVTTGSTLLAAARATGVPALSGLVATAPGRLALQAWRPLGRLQTGETAPTVVHP